MDFKHFFISVLLIGLLFACNDDASIPGDIFNDPNQKSIIIFDNSLGTCTAVVYSSHLRTNESIIAEIPAGHMSDEIEWYSGNSVPFFFSYYINLQGISAFTLNFVPEIGRDQSYIRLDPNKKINIMIPKLNETVSSTNKILSNNSYILIQNNSSFTIDLLWGSFILKPDNFFGTGVNSGERAQYTITNNRNVSIYKVFENTVYIDFPLQISTFEPGRVYSFTYDGISLNLIRSVDIILNNVAFFSQTIPTPAAPIVEAGDSEIDVLWVPVQDADIYEVYLSDNVTPPSFPIRTTMGTSAVIEELTNKTVYYIWIKAYNSNGFSDYSPVARATPWSKNDPPAIPQRPMIIPGVNQVTVSWNECAGAVSYEVYYNLSSTPPEEPAAETDKTSAVIDFLQSDTTYSFWVRAVNSAGKSAYSAREIGRANAPTVIPSDPAQPVLIADNCKLTVRWQPAQFAFEYEVWCGTENNPAQAQKYADVAGNITETVISGLINYTEYYVWIRAKNSAGLSGFSPSAAAKPEENDISGVTLKAPIVDFDDQQLIISWEAVEDAAVYEVWYSTTNNSAAAHKYGEDTALLSATINGLTNGTVYYIWIKAKNQRSESKFSPSASGIPNVSFTVNFNTNGGIPVPNQQTIIEGGKFSQPVTITKNGYIFDGWYKESDFSNSWNFANDIPDTDIILYAKWNPITYYIDYNKNSAYAAGNTASSSHVYDIDANLTANGYTCTGYKFSGWSTSTTGSSLYTNEQSVRNLSSNDSEIILLYAIWEPITYTVSYNVNGGAGTMLNSVFTYDAAQNLRSNTFTKPDHVFSGWAETEDGQVVYTDKQSVINLTETDGTIITLFAVWEDVSKVIGTNLAEKLRWLETNALSNIDYIIEVSTNEIIAPYNFTYTGKNNIKITLKGMDSMRVIAFSTNNKLFVIGTGVTLILDNNITLQGRSSNTSSVVQVNSGGTLIMNSGSVINGNTLSSSSGSGVYINGGTFTMNGGSISNNKAYGDYGGGVCINGGTFTMNDGSISNNSGSGGGVGVYSGTFTMNGGSISNNSSSYGGGVYIGGGTFIKTGNSIVTGYASDTVNGNRAVYSNSHAVYASSGAKRMQSTVGEGVDISYYYNNGSPVWWGDWE